MEDTKAPAGTPAPETAAPEAKIATADPRMEAFAQKERQLRRMQQELAAEKQRLASEATKYQTDYVPKSRLTEDPLQVLHDAGITPERISELLLNAPNNNDPTVKALRAEMRKIQEKQEATEKRIAEETTQRYQNAVKQIRSEVMQLVDANSNYETIKSAGMQEAVVALIEEEFNTTGVLLTTEQAAQQVEDKLVEEGMKLASLSKIQSRLAPKAEPPKAQAQASQSQVKTLTQSMTKSTPSGLSEKERVARAIAAFKGQST